MSDSQLHHVLDRAGPKPINITLHTGMAWVLVTDKGPGGPCGQSMATTCPHAVLHFFENEDDMRAAIATKGFTRNQMSDIRCGVIGEWASPGPLTIIRHPPKQS